MTIYRMQTPRPFTTLAIGDRFFESDENGFIFIPEEHVDTALSFNYAHAPVPEDDGSEKESS